MPLYVVIVAFFLWGFHVAHVKLIYVFFLLQAIATAIIYSAAVILRPFLPGVRISLQTTPSYTIAILVITMIVFPFIWYFFTHQLREAMEELRNSDFWMLCIPPILFFIVTVILNDLGGNTAIPQSQVISIFLLINATGLVTYYLNICLALNTARRIRLESSITAMAHQIEMQGQRYIELNQSIEAARVTRHDLRHHLSVMSAFVKKGDIDGLSDYLTEYQQRFVAENNLKLCDNYVVDAVVQHYLEATKEVDTQLDIMLNIPPHINIMDTDLAIVFGNLFENAVHAVMKQREGPRFIRARCSIDCDKLILMLDNSMESDEKKETGKSTGMGIGQSSVKNVAEKYYGNVRFEQKDNIYKAAVYLTIPSMIKDRK